MTSIYLNSKTELPDTVFYESAPRGRATVRFLPPPVSFQPVPRVSHASGHTGRMRLVQVLIVLAVLAILLVADTLRAGVITNTAPAVKPASPSLFIPTPASQNAQGVWEPYIPYSVAQSPTPLVWFSTTPDNKVWGDITLTGTPTLATGGVNYWRERKGSIKVDALVPTQSNEKIDVLLDFELGGSTYLQHVFNALYYRKNNDGYSLINTNFPNSMPGYANSMSINDIQPNDGESQADWDAKLGFDHPGLPAGTSTFYVNYDLTIFPDAFVDRVGVAADPPSVSSVPEPSTLATGLLASGTVLAWRPRRKLRNFFSKLAA